MHESCRIYTPQPRLTGDEYFQFVDEFIQACFHRWPGVIVQVSWLVSSVCVSVCVWRYLCVSQYIHTLYVTKHTYVQIQTYVHPYMHNVTHMDESWHTYKWDKSWWHSCKCLSLYLERTIWMSHVARVDESHHKYGWVTSHTWHTNRGALDYRNYESPDVWCSLLVPLNEKIRDWDQNAVSNSGSRNHLSPDLLLLWKFWRF